MQDIHWTDCYKDLRVIYVTKKLGHKEIEKNEIEVGIEINTLRVEAISLLLHASESFLIFVVPQ